MKIKLITIGKTDDNYLREGIEKYLIRLKHYINFEVIEIRDVRVLKKSNINKQK